MKTLFLAAAAALLAASPVLAEPHPAGGPSPGGGHPMRAHASHGMRRPESHGTMHHAPSAHFHHILVRESARPPHRVHRAATLHRPHEAFAVHSGHRATMRTAASVRHLHRNFTSPRRFHSGVYRRPAGWYAHRWSYGQHLPRAWFVRDYWIGDWGMFGLIAPPYGLVWVRVGDDALLIDPDTGEIYEVVYEVFW